MGLVLSWYKMGTRTIRWELWLKLTASKSAASCLFHLFLRFWNQIFTCVSVRCREAARPARSELLRYLFMSKVDSSWKTWLLLNTVRVFFFLAEPGSELSGPERSSKSCRASSPSLTTHSLVFRSTALSRSSEATGLFLSLRQCSLECRFSPFRPDKVMFKRIIIYQTDVCQSDIKNLL